MAVSHKFIKKYQKSVCLHSVQRFAVPLICYGAQKLAEAGGDSMCLCPAAAVAG